MNVPTFHRPIGFICIGLCASTVNTDGHTVASIVDPSLPTLPSRRTLVRPSRRTKGRCRRQTRTFVVSRPGFVAWSGSLTRAASALVSPAADHDRGAHQRSRPSTLQPADDHG